MTLCRGKLYLTYSTDLRIDTVSLCAGSMTLCRSFILRYYNLTAIVTVLTLGKTCFGTGGSNSRIGNLGVTLCGNCLALLLTARANADLLACLLTGGSFCNRPFAKLVIVEHIAGT